MYISQCALVQVAHHQISVRPAGHHQKRLRQEDEADNGLGENLQDECKEGKAARLQQVQTSAAAKPAHRAEDGDGLVYVSLTDFLPVSDLWTLATPATRNVLDSFQATIARSCQAQVP